jgi:hypothetical protein
MPFLLILLFSVFLLTACDEDEHSFATNIASGYAANDRMMEAAPAAPMMAKRAMRASEMALDRSQFKGRHIAENHNMQVEVPKEQLQIRYQRDLKKCIELDCELNNSNIYAQQNAYLHARIAPENLGKFLDFVAEGEGELKSHAISATDKTLQYVDNESKLKNQLALRERLLALLDSYKAKKIKDLLEIERELARVQSQIDSLTGQKRSLERVTAKATVSVNYTIPPKAVEIEYHDISNSFRYAWNGFLHSVSEVIAFVLKALPWIPVWFVGGWLLVKVFRFATRKSGNMLGKLAFWKRSEDV